MAAILKTVKLSYLGNGLTDLHEIRHDDHNDRLNRTGPNQMLFAGKTRAPKESYISRECTLDLLGKYD